MADIQLRSMIRHLRHIVSQGATWSRSDAELLEAFVRHRDEEAVEMLVWRHGAMVLNLCRRILYDEHHAEDAFQAAFLVLIRKAGSIGKCESVGSWLYKTAARIAYRLRSQLAKQPKQRAELNDVAGRDRADEPAWRDLRSVLDEEISRLPEKYRSPIVLCYLQGHTHEEASEILRCPLGTIWSRLRRGLEQLRTRFAQRGVMLSASGLASYLSVNAASASAPALLVDSTITAAMSFAAGEAASGLVSSSVAALTQGALRTMFISKLTKAAAVAIAAVILLVGAGSIGPWSQANSDTHRRTAFAPAVDGQNQKPPARASEDFYAIIKKVDGKKVTINRSTKDNDVADTILAASDKIKIVTKKLVVPFEAPPAYTAEVLDDLLTDAELFEDVPVEGGLKSNIFAQPVRARITTDAKNNIVEIWIHGLPYPK